MGQLSIGHAPTGAALWRDTSVVLPDGAPAKFRDELTGRSLLPDHGRLPVGAMFQVLPTLLAVGGD